MSENNEKKNHIRFAGMDIPVNLAWNKIEVLSTAADTLDRLNQTFPGLSTKFTQEVLPVVRKRLNDSLVSIAAPKQIDDTYIEFLKQKIKTHSPEECLDALRSAYNIDINLTDLIYHIGEAEYMDAMRREAVLYQENKILPGQTAELWNQLERPAPGKAHWTENDVDKLLGN